MSRIQYLYTEGRNDVPIPVRLDGRVVGTIKPVPDGWQYFPLRHKQGGEVFATADECQKSLEFDDDVDTVKHASCHWCGHIPEHDAARG